MFSSSAAAVAGPYFVKIAIDDGLTARNMSVLHTTVLAYLAVSLVQWVCTYLRINLMARVGQAVIYDLRTTLFDHLQRLSLGFFSHYSVGRIITRVINDVETLRDFLTWSVLAITRNLFTLALIVVVMLNMNLRLALLTFSVLPVMVAATVLFRRLSRRAYRKVRGAVSWVNSVLAENVNGVRVVQAFSRQKPQPAVLCRSRSTAITWSSPSKPPASSPSSIPSSMCSAPSPRPSWSGWAARPSSANRSPPGCWSPSPSTSTASSSRSMTSRAASRSSSPRWRAANGSSACWTWRWR